MNVSLSARYRRGGIYGRPSEVLQKSQLHQDATRARATADTPGSAAAASSGREPTIPRSLVLLQK